MKNTTCSLLNLSHLEPDRAVLTEEDGQLVERGGFIDDLAAIENLSTPMADPPCSRWQIDVTGALPLKQNRCDEHIRPEHIGILDCPGLGVSGKVVKQRADDRRAFCMRSGHQATDIGTQSGARECAGCPFPKPL